MLAKPLKDYINELITYGISAWDAYNEGESQVEVDYYSSLYTQALERIIDEMSDAYGFTPDACLSLLHLGMRNFIKKHSK